MELDKWGLNLKRLEEWIVVWLHQEKENGMSPLCKRLRRLGRNVAPGLRRYEELRVMEFVRMQDVEKFKRDVWDCMQVLQKIVNDYSVGPLSIIR